MELKLEALYINEKELDYLTMVIEQNLEQLNGTELDEGYAVMLEELYSKLNKMEANKNWIPSLKEFLKEDLQKLEHHTHEIIHNIYARGQQEEFKKDIEKIEGILIYWNNHIDKI